jgi:diguanylate cyclase (GGDEF)-like protein
MLDISQTYNQADDELTLASLLAAKLTLAAEVDAAIISRWDESTGFLRTLGVFGTIDQEAPWDVLDSPATRAVLRDAQPLVLHEGGATDPDEGHLLERLGARTLLLMPLVAGGRTIGLVRLFAINGQRVFGPDELGVYRTMANHAGAVLENVRLLERLRQAADVDQLTGVNNHRYLQERLKQEAARSTRSRSPFSLLMVDLDGFKGINDRHGHADGDRVLRAVAASLKLAVRTTDVVARYGGDEFVVFMPDTTEAQARTVAKRVVASVRDHQHELSDGTKARISASAGLAVYPSDGRSPTALLKAADAAMYAVKRAGGSNVGRVDRAAVAAAVRERPPVVVRSTPTTKAQGRAGRTRKRTPRG